MKKVGKIICILVIAALVIIMIISNNASAENYNVKLSPTSNSSVTAGQDITIQLTLSEPTTMLNGELRYETDKFTFKDGSAQGGGQWSCNPSDGSVAFIYLGQSTDSEAQPTSAITLSFTANEGINEQTTANFNILDFAVVTEGDGQYTIDQMEQNGSSFATVVTINPKNDPTPVDPTPVDPTPVDPTPVDPTPVDPTPVDPTPVDPTPVDPTPNNPTPSDPTPNEPTPSNPTPNNPTPSGGTSSGTTGSTSKRTSNGAVTNGGNSSTTASSTANETVPATGESSVGTLTLLVIITLIVASIIFRRKSKIE